jgi:predicted peptidase
LPSINTCHGNGEKGTLTPDLLRKSFLPYKLDGGLNVEMVVISPQTNGYKPKWNYAGWYRELLDSIKVKYRIDTNKIYIMGYSGGGEGVCTYVKTYPFIGVATFAPVITLTPIEKCVLVGKKLAAYHCLDDKTISPNITKNLIKDVKTCDTSFKPKVTYYQTGGHSPWKKGISDTLFNYLLSK